MKKIHLIIYSLFVINCIFATNTSPAFETDRIKETYNLLPNELKTIIENVQYIDTLINGNIIIPNSMLNILFNSDKEISHIGFNINKPEINYDYFEAYLFIENYLLNLSLDPGSYFLDEFANRNGLKFYINKTVAIPNLKKIKLLIAEIIYSKINLSFSNSKFLAIWTTYNNDSFEINFPANINLIKGMDKTDLERDFIRKLKTYTKVKRYEPINLSKIQPSYDELFIIKGNLFETDNFRADVYYKKNEFENYLPVFSSLNPVESFSNLFITDIDNSYIIENTFILYGNQKKTATYSFKKFHSCLSEKNLIFFGLNSYKLNILHASVIYYSPIYNYIHMLIAESDKQKLFNEKNNYIKSNLYLYIPRADLIKIIKKAE